MEIIQQLEGLPPIKEPAVLTIGFFDGLHRGHQAVLTRLKEVALQRHKKTTVLTFSDSPSYVLHKKQQPSQLYSTEHKILLLKEMGIDHLILLPFTTELAQLSAEQFLQQLHPVCPFDQLVLGYDTAFGKDKEGGREKIKQLGTTMGFQAEYIQPLTLDGEIVSSTQIRSLILQGNLKQAEHLLGRKYSIYSKVIHGAGRGKKLGFPTANIALKDFCLPPYGVYAVKIKQGEHVYQGAANLGVAPTVRDSLEPLLEVYLFDYVKDLYDEYLEVIFYAYVRPEIKFSSLDALKCQIQKDVEAVRALLKE